MKILDIHSEANREVLEAAAYYERQQTGLGRDFRIEFERAIAAVAHQKRKPRYWAARTPDDPR